MKQRTWNPTIELDAPLRWRKPYLVTLDVDLFDGKSDEQIAAVFGVMAACPSIIFRVWTAYPRRALEWFAWLNESRCAGGTTARHMLLHFAAERGVWVGILDERGFINGPWPLSNVWLGIIARTQAELDERAPEILDCPAAMHWLRLVLHERMDVRQAWERWLDGTSWEGCTERARWTDLVGHVDVSGAIGKDAPPCDIEWIREVIRQGRDAGVPVYVRALGSKARSMGFDRLTQARNGDRPGEWPADLRVREWPKGVEVNE